MRKTLLTSHEADYPAQTLEDLKNPLFESFLDMTRWMAAAIVCFGHLRNPLFYGFGSLATEEKNIFVIVWYFVTGWFGEAVIVFFVLSGYLVGGIGIARIANGEFSLSGYSVNRVTRLFVAFLPALLLTAALDYFGQTAFPHAGLYTHTQAMIAEKLNTAPFEALANWQNFVGNAFMLQTFIVEPFGSNQPLWTISVEFWFYMVFGLLVSLVLFEKPLSRLLCALLVVSIFLLLGAELIYFIGMWMIGAIAAAVSARHLESPVLALILFVAVLLVFRLFGSTIYAYQYGTELRSYTVALSFGYLLFSMRSTNFSRLGKLARFNKFMADFSFSLYLIHFPLMIFILSALYNLGYFPGIKTGYHPADGTGLFLYAALAVLIYVCAFMFSLVTERQTWRIRKAIRKVLS